MRKRLNLENPETFQEKIQWLKLHDRNPLYTILVDKVLVKEYVAEKVGNQYVIPMLGVWDRPEDIEWDKLPHRFVLKTNHSGGNNGVVICRNKEDFDFEKAILKLTVSLKENIYNNLREWPYKNVKKRVFAEEYVETNPISKDLPDYKWYCFKGEPKYCQVIQNRTTNETIDFYDTEWKRQEFFGLNPAAHPAAQPIAQPANLSTQILIAKRLSKDIPFARIDLYEIGDKVYFGEITFYPASGLGVFTPNKYDYILGKMIALPSV